MESITRSKKNLYLFFELFGEEVVKTEPTLLFVATRSNRVVQAAIVPEILGVTM